MSAYRIFISYSRKDRDLVLKISRVLEDNGFRPMWDRDFSFGSGFHDQIKNFIAHAHVFLPVLTPVSDRRKWVHQEIGYALALNIPVLPVAAGKLPGEMIQQIHAVQLGDDVGQLSRYLSREAVDKLVQEYSAATLATFQCADFPEDRAAMMARHCREVVSLGVRDLLRQKGGLSSLHIPDKYIDHPAWKARYGACVRGPSHCNLQREERLAIEEHVRACGCRLIVNPHITYEMYGQSARIARLESLLEFLESMPDERCQVAINPRMDHDQSLTILGDWFTAESVSARIGEGFRQTIFTKHAPSMQKKIEAFDQEFAEHLRALAWTPETSRTKAIGKIKEIVDNLVRDKK